MKSNLFFNLKLRENYSIHCSKFSLLTLWTCLFVIGTSCQSNSSTSEKSDNSTTTSSLETNTLRPDLDNKNNERDNLLADDYAANSENNTNSDNSNSFTKQDSLEFFKRFSPKTQTFVIDSDKDQHIFGEKGTHIFVEKSSFVFEDGTPVKSKVSVELKEFYDKKTILLAGLATQTANGFLESGGMIHLQATAEGKKVKLKKEITIEMPTSNTKVSSQEGMKVYFASNNPNSSLDRNSAFNPPTTWRTKGQSMEIQPPRENYFKWKYIGKLEHKNSKVDDSQCNCADVTLIHEKVETLSEAISYEIEFEHKKRNPNFLSAKVETTKLPKSKQVRLQGDKNTRVIGNATHLVHNFYPFLEDTTYYYDTLRIAFEIEKQRIGVVIEQLKSTNNAIESYTTQTAIRASSGLFITANLLKRGICPQAKNRFFLHSVQALSQVLPEVEGKRGEWKRIQNGTEEAYHLKYQKRKNPIMVWTGVIKTMKTSYNNEVYYEGKGRTYKSYVDEELKKQYEEAKLNYENWLQAQIENNPDFNAEKVANYAFQTKDMGWINCDRFYNIAEEDKTDLIVQTDSPVTLIFDNLNSSMKSNYHQKGVSFNKIPKNEKITLFSLKKKEGKLLMALQQTTIGNTSISLDYQEVSFQEMQDKLAFLE